MIDQSKVTKIENVPGAVRQEMIRERIPMGYGIIHKFFDRDGVVIRQDYHAVLLEGFDVAGET